MLLYALALSAAIGQDAALGAKVSFVEPGAATPLLVEHLSQAAHVQLFAPKAFERDILTVSVKDVPLMDLMAKIADLTAADWALRDGKYELVRSTAKLHAEEVAAYNREVAMFQKGIDKESKNLAKMAAWNETNAKALALGFADLQKSQPTNGNYDSHLWERMQNMEAQAPGGRAMTRVAAALSAKDLASLPDDYKTVFSDQPTKMQRPLPSSIIPALSQLVNEQNLWSDVAGRVLPDDSEENPGMFYSMAASLRKPFKGQMGKVLFMVTKGKAGGTPYANVEIVVADRTGAIVVRGSANVGASDITGEAFADPKPETGETPITPSPLTLAIKESMSGLQTGAPVKPLPREALDLLIHPEQHEPLALTAGDIFIKIADSKKENLVAELPDMSFMVVAYMAMEKVTPSMIVKTLPFMGIQSAEGDGWLILTPSAGSSVRSDRVDRPVLGAFLRAIAKKGRAGLDDLAAYAADVDQEMYESLGFYESMIISGNQQSEYYDQRMLRLYGLLDAGQKKTLAGGGSLALSSLSPAQAEALNKMVFGQYGNLQPKERPADETDQASWDAFYNGISREPTEIFGRGIPSNSTMQLTEQSDRVLFVPPHDTGGMSMGGRSMGIEEVAQVLYAKERPGLFPWLESDQPLDGNKFSLGTRRMLTFSFDFGDIAEMQQQLQDTTLDSDKGVPYDQIEKNFRDAVQKRLVEMRKEYANAKPGQYGGPGTGGTSPPPPPPP